MTKTEDNPMHLKTGEPSRLRQAPRCLARTRSACSTLGTITLAADLVEQDRRFQDFVVAHELLHLRVPNHGRLFKALMTAHVPQWRSCDMVR
jgi:predicted metal-dependent hydrolase